MVRLTPKQEKFCNLYIELGNATEAYRQSYDCGRMKEETISRNAKKLLDDNKISTRIEKLRSDLAEKHEITRDTLIVELEEARKVAKEERKASAMVSAIMGKARLLGLDKKIVKHEGEIKTSQDINLDTLNDEELALLERLALKLTSDSAAEG